VNIDTLSLIQRAYPDLVDDLLTSIVGGIVNEPIPFDVNQLRYALSQPAAAVRSVKGTIAGADGTAAAGLHVFLPNVDFAFSATDSSVTWLAKGTLPLDETTFYVDYFRPNTQSLLTDINVGSVTRTLTEAIGKEVATVYAEILNAYLAGFVDTAQGQSLDHVVAILGLTRFGAEFATGMVTFLRDPASTGAVTIADGTELATPKRLTFATIELRTLQQGQQRIDVPVRATGLARGSAGVVPAGSITVLQVPIAGIASATNFDPTTLGAAPETDDQLRARAKATLQGLGQATLAALARVAFEQRATLLEVRDPNGAPGKTSPPGQVVLLVATEPARYPSVNAALQQTRAAGVLASVVARYVFVTPRMALVMPGASTPAGKLKLVGLLIDTIQTYVDQLPAGAPASGTDMLAAIAQVAVLQAAKPRFLDVLAAKADVNDVGSQALVSALVTAVQAAPAADAASLTAAIANVLDGDPPVAFSENRTAARELIVGGSGSASDDEIEAGGFRVVTPSDGQSWSIALAMQPADIQVGGG
jgi:hypothetical protein